MGYQIGNGQQSNCCNPVTQTYYQGSYSYGYRSPRLDFRRALAPLTAVIREYDDLRLKLEREGGQMSDLTKITKKRMSVAGVL